MAKRRMTEREAKTETYVLWGVVAVILCLIGLALYGWWSGAWDKPPSEPAAQSETR